MIKYLVLLALIGCAPDLKYNDKVVVTDGFYEGRTGVVTDTYSFIGSNKCYVEFEDKDDRYIKCSYLKKVSK